MASVLERYGEKEDASEFELHLVRVDEKSGKVKRQGSFARLIPGQAAEKFCVVRTAKKRRGEDVWGEAGKFIRGGMSTKKSRP